MAANRLEHAGTLDGISPDQGEGDGIASPIDDDEVQFGPAIGVRVAAECLATVILDGSNASRWDSTRLRSRS